MFNRETLRKIFEAHKKTAFDNQQACTTDANKVAYYGGRAIAFTEALTIIEYPMDLQEAQIWVTKLHEVLLALGRASTTESIVEARQAAKACLDTIQNALALGAVL